MLSFVVLSVVLALSLRCHLLSLRCPSVVFVVFGVVLALSLRCLRRCLALSLLSLALSSTFDRLQNAPNVSDVVVVVSRDLARTPGTSTTAVVKLKMAF